MLTLILVVKSSPVLKELQYGRMGRTDRPADGMQNVSKDCVPTEKARAVFRMTFIGFKSNFFAITQPRREPRDRNGFFRFNEKFFFPFR